MNIEDIAINTIVRKNIINRSGLFDRIEGKIVLDIGAGTGSFGKKLYENGAKVICIDIDENNIRAIKKSLGFVFSIITSYILRLTVKYSHAASYETTDLGILWENL